MKGVRGKGKAIITVTREEKEDFPDLARLFRLLYERLMEKKVLFDPLNKFHGNCSLDLSLS